MLPCVCIYFYVLIHVDKFDHYCHYYYYYYYTIFCVLKSDFGFLPFFASVSLIHVQAPECPGVVFFFDTAVYLSVSVRY
jgi:hypothetical protein